MSNRISNSLPKNCSVCFNVLPMFDGMEASDDHDEEWDGEVECGVPLWVILKNIDIHSIYALEDVG